MPCLTADHITKRYGVSDVLKDVSLAIARGEKVGLVGANGSGKSTLSRILAGLEEPDGGTVARRRDVDFVYLAQEPELHPERTAYEEVEAGLTRWREAVSRYEAVSQALTRGGGDVAALTDEHGALAAEIDHLGGWDMRHRIVSALTHLGVRRHDQPSRELSGGERRRVALARVLVAQPGLAILDEPTNHLDADAAEWLEQHLREEFAGAVLLVTHDRYLLDRVVTRIIEIDRGEAFSYDGNYGDWIAQKTERLALESRTESRRLNLLRREQEWLARGPSARGTKQKARIQRAGELSDTVARDKRSGRELELTASAVRTGRRVIELRGVTKRYGERTIFEHLDLALMPGERLGVVGPNGVGKTTLLRVLLGEELPDAGEVVRGLNTRAVYFDQSRSSLDDAASVMVNVAGDNDKVKVGGRWMDARGYLEKFLFDPTRFFQPVGALSGGERARVALAKLLQEEANLLVLDEPTNDLDLATLGALEEMLCEWPGSAVIVSHDRWFLNRVSTAILAFEGDGRVLYQPGDWDTWRSLRDERLRAEAAAAKTAVAAVAKVAKEAAKEAAKDAPSAKPLTLAEQKELDGLLAVIDAAEAEAKDAEARLNDPALYAGGADVSARVAEAAAKRQRLDALMARWEALEARRDATAKR
jgi:ATP-binding cassette subfamily F protein uup